MSPHSDRRSLFWSLQLVGWTAFGVAMALSRLGRYPIDYMVATKFVLSLSGFVVSLGLREVYQRTVRVDTPHLRLVLITAGTSYLAALPWTAFYNVTDAMIATTLLDRQVAVRTFSQLTSGAVYHAFALLAWSIFYAAIKRHFALEVAQTRAIKAEAYANQARLQALRLQLQPHFLFNTLNALSTLIVEERTADASRMVSRIADFLRLTLADDVGADQVPLDDELEFVRRYLEIERVRMGERLAVQYDIDVSVRRALVPSLLLQPLVENAVRHGISRSETPGVIRIDASPGNDSARLLITITNTGDKRMLSLTSEGGGPHESAARNGVGLSNTRARLEHLYGTDFRLQLIPMPDGGMRVEVELPMHRTGSSRDEADIATRADVIFSQGESA